MARRLSPRDATDGELLRVHREAYLEALSRTDGKQGFFDADTYFGPRSVAAARRAAGGALAMTDALLTGEAAYGLALLRPPGHHARPAEAMGFCLLNNVAVAAAHARARGAERVAIVDWDVHHGNGTQEIFYADPSVLYVSLHQSPFYPGTGAVSEVGRGDGRGATVNVPLTAGAGDPVYAAAFERIVRPVLDQFAPDLVLISAGFDAHARDPLGSMCVTAGGYVTLLRAILAGLPNGGRGRVGLVLEGGYDLAALEESLEAILRTLMTADAPVAPSSSGAGSPLTQAHEDDLARARDAARQSFQL